MLLLHKTWSMLLRAILASHIVFAQSELAAKDASTNVAHHNRRQVIRSEPVKSHLSADATSHGAVDTPFLIDSNANVAARSHRQMMRQGSQHSHNSLTHEAGVLDDKGNHHGGHHGKHKKSSHRHHESSPEVEYSFLQLLNRKVRDEKTEVQMAALVLVVGIMLCGLSSYAYAMKPKHPGMVHVGSVSEEQNEAIMQAADEKARGEWKEKLASARKSVVDVKATSDIRLLLTSDGLSNGYLKNAFLKLMVRDSVPTDMKALVLTDSHVFRDDKSKIESFKENLKSIGWPEENIDTLNLIDKVFIPAEAKETYNGMVKEAKQLYDLMNSGQAPGEGHEMVGKMHDESVRLNDAHPTELNDFLAKLETYDLICGDGGDVVIANFALKINPGVVSKIKELVSSGKTAYMGRSAGAMVASKDMHLSGEFTKDFASVFLAGNPEGNLYMFNAPIAFRPHYTDAGWGDTVKQMNTDADIKDQNGTVYVPVKDGEGILVSVDANERESCLAVIRRNTIIDEIDHILNYLPRGDIDDSEPSSSSGNAPNPEPPA